VSSPGNGGGREVRRPRRPSSSPGNEETVALIEYDCTLTVLLI
jgi:hypothetical protein